MRRELPKTVALGRVIASRKFTLSGKPKAKPELRIGTPVTVEDSAYCPVQLVGIGDERVQPVWGVDRVQALQLVFRYLDALLLQHGNRLRWEGVTPLQGLHSDPWRLFDSAGLSEFLSKFAALCAEQAAAQRRPPAPPRRKSSRRGS